MFVELHSHLIRFQENWVEYPTHRMFTPQVVVARLAGHYLEQLMDHCSVQINISSQSNGHLVLLCYSDL